MKLLLNLEGVIVGEGLIFVDMFVVVVWLLCYLFDCNLLLMVWNLVFRVWSCSVAEGVEKIVS